MAISRAARSTSILARRRCSMSTTAPWAAATELRPGRSRPLPGHQQDRVRPGRLCHCAFRRLRRAGHAETGRDARKRQRRLSYAHRRRRSGTARGDRGGRYRHRGFTIRDAGGSRGAVRAGLERMPREQLRPGQQLPGLLAGAAASVIFENNTVYRTPSRACGEAGAVFRRSTTTSSATTTRDSRPIQAAWRTRATTVSMPTRPISSAWRPLPRTSPRDPMFVDAATGTSI